MRRLSPSINSSRALKSLILICFFQLSVNSQALLVSLEPDDFSIFEEIENQYVKALSDYDSKNNGVAIMGNITKCPLSQTHCAATGNKTFGNHGFTFFGSSVMGLRFDFAQPVSNVSIWGFDSHPEGIGIDFAYLNSEGDILKMGYLESSNGIAVRFEFPETLNMVSLIVGGHDSISTVTFDKIAFSVEVSEPFCIVLFLGGIVLLFLSKSSNLRRSQEP